MKMAIYPPIHNIRISQANIRAILLDHSKHYVKESNVCVCVNIILSNLTEWLPNLAFLSIKEDNEIGVCMNMQRAILVV